MLALRSPINVGDDVVREVHVRIPKPRKLAKLTPQMAFDGHLIAIATGLPLLAVSELDEADGNAILDELNRLHGLRKRRRVCAP